jgi:hypothetical protein
VAQRARGERLAAEWLVRDREARLVPSQGPSGAG